MRKLLCVVAGAATLTLGCAERDARHPIAIAIAGKSPGAAATPAAASSAVAKPKQGATLSPADAQAQFTQCVRKNGIDMPDFDSAEARTWRYTGDQATLQKAIKACEEYAKQIPNPYDDPKVRDQLVKFARCMRDQGIDMPDPPQQNWSLDPNAPAFQKAMAACRQHMPSFGGSQ
ncbi:hypothetical protein OHA25_49720 [Nonomuraea sp. NBC_00507]|uniref:hypothetical protein n=1 Tax=unclassified Nonomuraea TaxID=2593643 RepID=UPI00273CC4B2|nr:MULTISPECIES: hypothetical protein [unclassified Nonomuraea]MDP4502347.1 hypothetical protein [Nonomuraea sp. G32]